MSKERSEKEKPLSHKHSTNMNLVENNPCLREQKASLRCLDEKGYEQSKCTDQFANYQACMGFWNKIKHERRRKGITPLLPPPEEREQIVKQYYGQ